MALILFSVETVCTLLPYGKSLLWVLGFVRDIRTGSSRRPLGVRFGMSGEPRFSSPVGQRSKVGRSTRGHKQLMLIPVLVK